MLQIGVDLARDRDRTAMVTTAHNSPAIALLSDQTLKIGTKYTEQITALYELLNGFEGRCAIDATGVGAAVCDLLEAKDLGIERVTIGSGKQVHRNGNSWTIPKGLLLHPLVLAIEQDRLDLSKASVDLKTELRNFACVNGKLTGKLKGRDDLVIALALSVFPFHAFA